MSSVQIPVKYGGLPDLLNSLHASLPRSVIVRRFGGSRAGKIEQLPLSFSLSLIRSLLEEKGNSKIFDDSYFISNVKKRTRRRSTGRVQRFLKKDFFVRVRPATY